MIDEFAEKDIMSLIEDVLEPSNWKETDFDDYFYRCRYCYGRARRRFDTTRIDFLKKNKTPEEELAAETVIHDDDCMYSKALRLKKYINNEEGDTVSDQEIQVRSQGTARDGDDTF